MRIQAFHLVFTILLQVFHYLVHVLTGCFGMNGARVWYSPCGSGGHRCPITAISLLIRCCCICTGCIGGSFAVFILDAGSHRFPCNSSIRFPQCNTVSSTDFGKEGCSTAQVQRVFFLILREGIIFKRLFYSPAWCSLSSFSHLHTYCCMGFSSHQILTASRISSLWFFNKWFGKGGSGGWKA